MKTKNQVRLILLAVIAGSILVYFTIPQVQDQLNKAFTALGSMNVQSVIALIRSYGVFAAVVSFLLMILQSVAAPIPAFLLTFANAAIFGWIGGAALSWSSAMAGAAICFFIAKILGRDMVEKLTSKTALQSVDEFFQRYGKHTILIARLLPFVSFDLVSYAAGLTPMKVVPFLLATGLGQLPATLVYSYIGGMLTGSVKVVVTGLMILFAVVVMGALLKKVYQDRHKSDTISLNS
jgi:uncharacterized membrane protein YdjX (TVP38/TMEM64 family)